MSADNEHDDRLTFELSTSDKRKLREIAKKHDVSVAHLMRKATDWVIGGMK